MTDEDIAQEKMEFIIDEIKEILFDYGFQSKEKMQILASVAVQLLINEMVGKEDAMEMLSQFNWAIASGVKFADENKLTTWVSGPGN
jgi:hypothetical protein